MPGFNGTGPMGQGGGTGWGRGYCRTTAPPDISGYYGGMAMRRGRGIGAGQGYGRGARGFGRGFFGVSGQTFAGTDELTMLKQEADTVQNRLDSINARIAKLEKSE